MSRPDEQILQRIQDLVRYSDQLKLKSTYIENDSNSQEQSIENQETQIKQLRSSFDEELSEIKDEIKILVADYRSAAIQIHSLIGEFRSLVKQEDFEKLKAKVDSMKLEFIEQM